MTEQPTQLHRAIEAAKVLRQEIAKLVVADKVAAGEMAPEDAETIQDTFDGETTLDAELEKALHAEDDDKILVDGIDKRLDELKGRKDRIKKRIEARRGLVEQAMTVAGWNKKETALGTLSLSKSADSIGVDDESLIPAQYWKRAEPSLDRTLLGKDLKEFHKAVTDAANIADVGRRCDVLAELAGRLPYSTEINGAMLSAAALNDHAARADAMLALIRRFSLVPGAHLDLGGQHLTIRRK